MDFIETLRKVGLSEHEALVYRYLLQRKKARLSSISQGTNINRPTLYKVIKEMLDRNLVNKITLGKSTFYQPVAPEHLEKYYLKQQAPIEKSLSEMQNIYQQKRERPVVEYHEGSAGINHVYDDVVTILPRGGMFYRYSAKVSTNKPTDYYLQTRDSKNIERKAITSQSKMASKKQKLDRFTKAIPADFDLFDDDVSFLVYKDKVAFIDYENKTSITIKSEKIARFQEKLFKLLWKKL